MKKTIDYLEEVLARQGLAGAKEHAEIRTIDRQTFDEERALYGTHNAAITRCTFDGPQDGESALKECGNLYVGDCDFRLRYPLWHVRNAHLEKTRMSDTCRAALWYCQNMTINACRLDGIKAVRECDEMTIEDSTIRSAEFGWLSRGLKIRNTKLESEYPFFSSSVLMLDHFVLRGKYSFQYVKNVTIRNSTLDTKDAFWHSRNVTISDSVVKGEYLGWYSENLKLVRCKIIGTQPLCYAHGLVLEECEMVDCDLAFERSDVQATLRGTVTSFKNPARGHIVADGVDEVILNDELPGGGSCTIEIRQPAHCGALAESAGCCGCGCMG